MTNVKVSIEFNQDNKLAFVVRGNVEQEININDEVKAKFNKLIEKTDTSNALSYVNANFTDEVYDAMAIAFENAVNKEYKRVYES